MKLVYKCDFCDRTEQKKQKMKEHESQCDFDPRFKKCWSCKNLAPLSQAKACKKGLDIAAALVSRSCAGYEYLPKNY
jgi:hypothetical protein